MYTRSSLLAAGCTLLIGFSQALSGVDPADFTKKLELSFDGYSRPSTLTNFPALITLSTAIDGFSYADFASASGADLRFCASATTNELPFEIDHWNTAGSSFVWVRVPALTGAETRITAYWGSTNTTLPAYATNGAVWAADYATVWHFEESSRTGPYSDSSPAGNTGITGQTLNNVVVGLIGQAKYLDNAEYVESIQDSPITGALPRTTSIWLKSGDSRGHIASLGYDDRSYGVYSLCAFDRDFHVWWGGSNVTATTRGVNRNTWLHAALSYDGTTASLYVNGTEVASGPLALDTAPYRAVVGSPAWQTYAGTYRFSADEFRVSTVARHPDWMWATWRSQSAPTNFTTYGQVRRAVDTLPEVVNQAPSDISIYSATFSGTVTSTGAAPTQVTLYWGESDAGQTTTGWDGATPLGTVTSTVPMGVSTNISSLSPETRYYYRFYATNAYGNDWASPAASFWTLSAEPRIENRPATDLDLTSATLQGSVTYTGAAPVEVAVYWGAENGGTDPAAWSHTNYLGTNALPVPAAVSTGIGGLSPKRTYYYRFYATNAYGDAWAPSTTSFATADEIPRSLIPAGSVWQYLDDGTDQGTNWAQVSFDAGSWSNGLAELGYGDDGEEATVISFGGDPTNKHMTYYFRHELDLTAAEIATMAKAEIRLRRDDGGVVYLNGKEIFRSNMPTGPIDYLTPAGDQTGSEVAYHPLSFDPRLFRDGTNVVAVEIHQQAPSSSDVSFDLELESAIVYPAVGFYPVPSVTNFTLEASYRTLASPAPNDYSGIALREKSNEIIVPNRSWSLGIATIQVHGMDGAHHRMIGLPGWDDVEGVRVIDPVTDTYAILEEGNGDITLVTIDDQTTEILKTSGVTYSSGIDGSGNKGLEGVAYDARRDCFYVVKEKFPLSVFRISGPPTNTTTTPLFDGATVFAGLATDLSDVAYDPGLDHLLILSDEAATVFECTLDGNIVAALHVEGGQPEGVALSADGTELHIASEPSDYFRYRRGYLSSHSQEGTNLAIRVGLTSPWTNAVTVAYSLNSGTAIVGQDVTNASGVTTGVVTFAVGTTEAFIPLDIVDDGIYEDEELFTVTLSGAINAVLDSGREHVHVIDPYLSRLNVMSSHGTPTPARGTNTFIQGAALSCRMTGSPVDDVGTQYVCLGWVGTGSIPSEGGGTATGPLAITNDSAIVWRWTTNYWLTVSTESGGSVDAGNTWYPRGTGVVLTATAKPYVTFAGWSGDTPTNDTNNVTLAVTMDRSLAVTARFSEQMATNNTPIWWLAEHYGATNGFNLLALSDTDEDGLAAWQEYRTGTLPTNSISRLAIVELQIADGGTGHTIYWDSTRGRTYGVYASTSLVGSAWIPLHQLPGSGERLSYTDMNTWTRPVYYRVTARSE